MNIEYDIIEPDGQSKSEVFRVDQDKVIEIPEATYQFMPKIEESSELHTAIYYSVD